MLRLRHRHAVAGTMMTELAFFMMKAHRRRCRLTSRSAVLPPAAAAASVPKPPRMTLKIERFMPLHMM